MKKIRCELDNGDYAQISVEDGFVNLYVDQDDDVNVVVFSPAKIRKLRKQLKKALLQIEGVKKAEGDWFSPGKKVVITGDNTGFPVGEVVVVSESGRNDEHSKKCEHLDGRDYYYVRPSDCKPYKEDEA
ncbi:MAG: hypothetical protein [Bacteriophage sp.]|nr:MAG: hypothetical protein [Bacteriophage sp.]